MTAGRRRTQLDALMPVWNFGERHEIKIDAPAARVFAALRQVKANEIFLFRTLTWIRRGGRSTAPSILTAGSSSEPVIDYALRHGFTKLAEVAERELVIGTVIAGPRGGPTLTATTIKALPTGYTVAAMNFEVRPVGLDKTILTTETRVYANTAAGRRAFSLYWHLIYPGSALIRRMWLRAVRRRATAPSALQNQSAAM